MKRKCLFIVFILLCNIEDGNTELLQYFREIGEYFGYGKQHQSDWNDDILEHTIPYEVSAPDEKFISEAAKLTGVALSKLDSCQHRVVLKLQTACDKMNDEQLAKMAVMLLNCQSSVEGRKVYPCTDSMNIKDCTSSMDADTWNSYHLMSNRARAVCYSVRQNQFRGLTEYTVNKLMDAAHNQLFTLDKIAKEQENLHGMAENSLNVISEGQKRLINQQKDFEMVQLHGQLAIEDNIRRLMNEKRLIVETHQELTQMTRSVQDKIEHATLQLEAQTEESRANHRELLDDLIAIHNKAQVIFQRIEESSELLLKQSIVAHKQYEATLAQLAEVNATVHALVDLVGGSRKVFEEQLTWLSTALGGTDLAVGRLYAILWHITFLLLAMVSCAFLGAQTSTRFIVSSLPTSNLILTLQQNPYALEPVELCTTTVGLVFVQIMFRSIMKVWRSKLPQQALHWSKLKLTQQKSEHSPLTSGTHSSYHGYEYRSSHAEEDLHPNEERDSFDFSVPTSRYNNNGTYLSRSRSRTPTSLNGTHKGACGAKTRLGTPCKLPAVLGRDFCYRHQSGDSIFAG